ncbi:MAG: phenylalanine--tRNA ligase subunit beta [Bacteroidetes bacterium]|nr:phenylalanine--tRNA ligase subunit beta [Bacteroidota bacterium]
MKISRKWIEQLVDLNGVSDQDIATRLTMAGIEVESFENLSEKYNGFVVGSVMEVVKHPNADKLRLCQVDIAGEIKSIICGAPNVSAGQKVPVGLVGALVPHDQHDPDGKPFQLTRAKIRGIESEGMICSEYELALGDDKNGIMVFEEDAPTGKPLAEYLGMDDTIFEVSLTPNRADCLSHLGIARELSSAFSRKLNPKKPSLHETGEPIAKAAKVEVSDPELCPRYSARVVKGIKIGRSPRWLRVAVEKAGMRSINNVVDATNYVMLELGQPLHAFDLNLIEGHKIIVRRPHESEMKFATLDGKERALSSDMLMICDKDSTIAIAGVMGGANSEINPVTTDILIESANFSPSSVRRTSKKLGLSTEASYRFERGVDPNLTLAALDRVTEIIVQTGGGTVAQGVIDIASTKFAPRRIELHVDQVNRLLGTRLASGEIRRLLESIEIHCDKKSETIFVCFAPTFRGDLEREVDLIEEVGRLYGYEKIEEQHQTRLVFDTRFKETNNTEDLKGYLAGSGFNEIVTNSLQPTDVAGFHSESFVKIANPISEDMASLRTSLLPGALQVVKLNLSYGLKDLKLFEMGRIYSSNGGSNGESFAETEMLSILLTGSADPISFDRNGSEFDIFDLKTEVERLLKHLNLDNWDFIPYDSTREYKQVLKLFMNGSEVGILGQVSETALDKFSIKQGVYFAELNLAEILSARKKTNKFHPLPKFPFASFDLAFIVDSSTPVGSLINSLKSLAGNLFRDIYVFDIYSGSGIPEGKISVAFSVILGSDERTLNDGDIARFIENAESKLAKEFAAALRKQSTK